MADIHIHTCTDQDGERWDEFVRSHAGCTSYHRWCWKFVFEKVFRWPAIYLLAEDNGEVRGILPLIKQKCLRRSYLSSMPHLQGGGIVADEPEIEGLLFQAAVATARQTNAAYLELRNLTKHDLPLVLRQDKVGAVLPIEVDREQRFRRLNQKTRNNVKKSLTFGMTAVFGGPELLGPFHDIYRQNMRDLGSPAYSLRFFSEILSCFPNDTQICVARQGDDDVAAAFMIGFRETLEVAWASSHRRFLDLKPNVFTDWSILEYAANRGYRFLDFGRSSRDSGTYKFKMRWGAVPASLYWGYWLNRDTALPGTQRQGMQVASRIWRHLPAVVTNLAGPVLIKQIPGI